MKENYDVLVVGAGTAGIYFAREMASKGYSVCVIDAMPAKKLGEKLPIFHCDSERFPVFGIPEPKPGDDEYIGMFESGTYYSPFSQYLKRNDGTECIKRADYPFYALRLPEFIKRQIGQAEAAGAEFYYETPFSDLTFGADGRINGAKVKFNGKEKTVSARLVADCSGMNSVVRRKLPETAKVGTFDITDREKFFVILRYVKFKNPEDYPKCAEHWAYWKSWIGLGTSDDLAIIGTGANLSYEYAETCYQRFAAAVQMPEHEVVKIEKGATPYRPAPYSLVADGFVCMGDSACMTKWIGEGIASSWVGCKILADTAGEAMKDGAYPTEEKLWEANVKYNTTQAANFAYIVATLVNAIECTAEENEYQFQKEIVFSTKAMTRLNRTYSADLPVGEVFELIGKVIGGVVTKNISMHSVKCLLRGILYAAKLKTHYRNFPKTPLGFEKWKAKADALWKATGSMAEVTEKIEAMLIEKEKETAK
ncbi:MAG: FAD-dependent monooxygenase [Clostridiales bacterium]|jgi:flavin-dependent dehydrogenase|nr:FAD-dependent monooxygenase [Clostridiales bacterium]